MLNSYRENTLGYDIEKCIGCEMCWNVCPHAVFAADGRKAKLIRPLDCMECGACALNCPTGAISVKNGVGCAAAMIQAALRGTEEVSC